MLLSIAQLPFSAKSPVPLRSPQGLADDRIPRFFSPPPKKPSTREREYLRTDEIKAMIRAAKKVGRPIKWDNIMVSGMEELFY